MPDRGRLHAQRHLLSPSSLRSVAEERDHSAHASTARRRADRRKRPCALACAYCSRTLPRSASRHRAESDPPSPFCRDPRRAHSRVCLCRAGLTQQCGTLTRFSFFMKNHTSRTSLPPPGMGLKPRGSFKNTCAVHFPPPPASTLAPPCHDRQSAPPPGS